jgi:uncharacterized 2Fe-2S/4Fe-4S cluster protein (DUF4445 family)
MCIRDRVDIIASLIESGVVNRLGKFKRNVGNEGVLIANEDTEGGKSINLNERDIDALQRAKAAVAAGTIYLLQEANMQPRDIKRIYTCGAFGRFLNIVHAQEIGLLPSIPPQQVKLYGNAALAGCEYLLLSSNRSAILNRIKAKTKTFNLALYPLFEQQFVESLFLQPMQEKIAGRDQPGREEVA